MSPTPRPTITPPQLAAAARAHLDRCVELLRAAGFSERDLPRRRGCHPWDQWIREALAAVDPDTGAHVAPVEAHREWAAAESLWWQLALTGTAKIVHFEARRHLAAARGRYDVEDLEQAARHGLFVAAQKWTPGAGATWRSYATHGARQRIRYYLREGAPEVVRIPEWRRSAAVKAREAQAHLERQGRPSTLADAAAYAGVSAAEVEPVIAAAFAVPLDARLGDEVDGSSLHDVLADDADPVDELVERQRRIRLVVAAVERLPPRDAAIVLAHLDGRTNRSIADELGVTRQRVQVLRARALEELERQVRQVRDEVPDAG